MKPQQRADVRQRYFHHELRLSQIAIASGAARASVRTAEDSHQSNESRQTSSPEFLPHDQSDRVWPPCLVFAGHDRLVSACLRLRSICLRLATLAAAACLM